MSRWSRRLPASRPSRSPAAASACCCSATLILITSYAKAASGIAKFQSWQLIVRYGGTALSHGDPEEFKASTGFAFALDVVSGIGGMIVAVALAAVHRQLGRDQPDNICGSRCSIARCCRPWARRRPSGVLRALDRFDLISWRARYPDQPRAILAGIAFIAGRAVRRSMSPSGS